MGRPEKPIVPDALPSVRRIATGLRVQRRHAGVSYPVLARRAGYSVASLAAAASGRGLPSRALTLAYASGCGGDLVAWERWWVEAYAELHGVSKPPDPTEATDPAQFVQQLHDLLVWHGLTSLDEIAQASGVARSTASRARTGPEVPAAEVLEKLLAGCGLDADARRVWAATRLRLLGIPGSVGEVFGEPAPPAGSAPAFPSDAGLTLAERPSRARLGRRRRTPTLRPARVDRAVLLAELTELRRGDGLGSIKAIDRLGPALRGMCGIDDGYLPADAHAVSTQFLVAATEFLSVEERRCVDAALNLLPDASPPRRHSFPERIEALAGDLGRDQEATLRQVEDALGLLVEIVSYPEILADVPGPEPADRPQPHGAPGGVPARRTRGGDPCPGVPRRVLRRGPSVVEGLCDRDGAGELRVVPDRAPWPSRPPRRARRRCGAGPAGVRPLSGGFLRGGQAAHRLGARAVGYAYVRL